MLTDDSLLLPKTPIKFYYYLWYLFTLCKAVAPSVSRARTWAPALINNRTISSWPKKLASWSAVDPNASFPLTSGRLINVSGERIFLTISKLPCLHARCKVFVEPKRRAAIGGGWPWTKSLDNIQARPSARCW